MILQKAIGRSNVDKHMTKSVVISLLGVKASITATITLVSVEMCYGVVIERLVVVPHMSHLVSVLLSIASHWRE